MRLAWGRPEVFFVRNFDMECVSDQVRTALEGKIWVVVDMLAEQSAARRQVLPNTVHELRTYNLRLRLGVNQAADSSTAMSKLSELGAGRRPARRASAWLHTHALASRPRSAAGSPGASRARAPHV